MRVAIAIAVGVLACAAQSARAEAPRFLIEVEQNQVAVGETFQAQVTLSASSDDISDYRPPEFKGLRVLYAPRAPNQSTQMQFGAAGMIVQVTYAWRYQLAASRPGGITIGPARVRINGQEFKSSIATLSAGGASGPGPGANGSPSAGASPNASPGPGPSGSGNPSAAPRSASPGGADSSGSENADERQGGSFIRLVADKTKVFVGEAISATWFLYMNQPHDKYDTVVEPRMEGFWSEDVTTPSRRGSLILTQELLEGRPYQVGAILKKALFPLKAGRLTVTPMEANLARVDFFGTALAQQHVRSPTTSFEVSPLPTDGQPAGFDPANVGRFTLSAQVDRTRVAVGEAVTLTVEISGRGNLRKVGLPALPALAGWKAYEPRINTVIDPATGVTGTKSAEILLLPERAGTVEVGKLVLAFFDPDGARYASAEAPGFALTATGDATAAAGSAPGGASNGPHPPPGGAPNNLEGPGQQNLLGNDIRPPRTRPVLRSDVGATLLHRPIFGGLVLIPPLLLAFGLLGLLVRDHLSADTEGRRQRLTRRRVLARLAAAESYRRNRQVGPFFAEIERVIRESIGTRLGRPATGMGIDELREALRARGLVDPEIDRLAAILDECDRARFAPGALAEPDGVMSAAAQRASQLIGQLASPPRASHLSRGEAAVVRST